MSVTNTTRKESFTMGTASYDFTFRTLLDFPEYIKCTVTEGGTDGTLTYTTDYTVSVDSDGVGGTVTVTNTRSATATLLVYRDTTDTQESTYNDYNQFPGTTTTKDFDKRTMVTQEILETVGRCVKVGITSTLTSISLPDGAADEVIGWDSTGTDLENKTLASLGAVILATQAEAEAGTDNSAYMSALRTAQAIAAQTSASTAVTVTRGTFTDGDLTAGVLTITHGQTLATPFGIPLAVTDSNQQLVIPDDITYLTDTITVDLSNFGTIAGTWGYAHIMET